MLQRPYRVITMTRRSRCCCIFALHKILATSAFCATRNAYVQRTSRIDDAWSQWTPSASGDNETLQRPRLTIFRKSRTRGRKKSHFTRLLSEARSLVIVDPSWRSRDGESPSAPSKLKWPFLGTPLTSREYFTPPCPAHYRINAGRCARLVCI